MTFDKTNYMLMGLGVILIALGLVLLSGGGSMDPEVFNESIFNSRRLVLAPIVMLAGFGIEFYAIMRKPKTQEKDQ
jgi:NhaP-type Na+/H+ or K+/H+ antiporter